MKKPTNLVRAKDIITSLAKELPSNLILDTESEHGKFTKNFLLKLTDEQLDQLCEEAKKQKNENISLIFYELKEGSKEPATRIEKFNSFKLSDVKSITFNGNTLPRMDYNFSEIYHYVAVTLVTP